MCLRYTVLYDASSCPWRQLMLQKMTKLAEISSAFSSQAEQFLYAIKGIFICAQHCQWRKPSLYGIILRRSKQGFCIAICSAVHFLVHCLFFFQPLSFLCHWRSASYSRDPFCSVFVQQCLCAAPLSWEKPKKNRVKGLVSLGQAAISLLPSCSAWCYVMSQCRLAGLSQ